MELNIVINLQVATHLKQFRSNLKYNIFGNSRQIVRMKEIFMMLMFKMLSYRLYNLNTIIKNV